jgi:hypothetical protein
MGCEEFALIPPVLKANSKEKMKFSDSMEGTFSFNGNNYTGTEIS